jgi:hypothetical protein
VLTESKPEVQGHLSAGLFAMVESCGTAMAGAERYDNPQLSVLFDVTIAAKGSPFYGAPQPIPRNKTWSGKL